VLHDAEAGVRLKDLCRLHGFQRSLVLPVAQQVRRDELLDAKQRKEVETENARLKKLLAERRAGRGDGEGTVHVRAS
jgi:putative transposase